MNPGEQQANDLFHSLLRNNRGLFVGELHTDPLAARFIIANLQKAREEGATTLYLEQNDLKAQAIAGGTPCYQQFMGPTKYQNPRTIQHDVVESALALGYRVIGHDSLTGTSWMWDRTSDGAIAQEQLTGASALKDRDDYAADIIEDTYDGKKFIAYGGAIHHGLATQLNIPSLSVYDPARFLANEPIESKLQWAQKALQQEGAGVFIAPGLTGESTYKIAAMNSEQHLFTDHPEQLPLALSVHQERLKAAAARAVAEGACTAPIHYHNQIMLDEPDQQASIVRHNARSEDAPKTR